VPRPPHLAATNAAIRGAVYSSFSDRLNPSSEVFALHVGDTYLEPPPGCTPADWTEQRGLYRYSDTQGLGAVREEVAAAVGRRTGTVRSAAQIYLTAGATAGLYVTLQTILDPGDEVLILAPYWPLIEGMTHACNARPRPVPIEDLESADELLERLERGVSPRTAAVYYSSPNNPTGRLLPPQWIEALAQFAARHDLWLIADDVYDLYAYSGPHSSALGLAPERTVVAYSASKAYAMAGNRCGWLTAPDPLLAAIQKTGIHAFYSAPTTGQWALHQALTTADDWILETRRTYQETGRRVARILDVDPPGGGTFFFLDISDALGPRGLAGFLEHCADHNLLLAPGPSFGPYPTAVRICFTAAPPDVIERAARLLADLLEQQRRQHGGRDQPPTITTASKGGTG
jgi:N-succinyldiaminopimelate aminotransferase